MVQIPNLNLITLGAIAIGAFFLVREIRGAGQDLANFGKDFKPFEGFKLPDIKFPDFNFPNLSNILGGDKKEELDLSGIPTDEEVKINEELEKTTIDPNTDLSKFNPAGIFGFGFLGFEDKGISNELAEQLGLIGTVSGDLTQQQLFQLSRIGTGITSTDTLFDAFSRRDDIIFARTFGLDVPIIPQQPSATVPDVVVPTAVVPTAVVPDVVIPDAVVLSELPTEQEFVGGGVSFIGGTIRENPIDTLKEVLEFFPELTASQASDFLLETQGKILPSQVDLIDPDIKNITANIDGVNVQVTSSPLENLSIRESENQKAVEFTCKEFGLNCELVGMA